MIYPSADGWPKAEIAKMDNDIIVGDCIIPVIDNQLSPIIWPIGIFSYISMFKVCITGYIYLQFIRFPSLSILSSTALKFDLDMVLYAVLKHLGQIIVFLLI